MSSKTETGSCNDLETDPADDVVSGSDDDMGRRPGRRTFLKGIGASAAGYVALGSDYGPVGDAEAVAPLIALGVVGASAGVGWAVREFEIIGSDPPAEGLTPETLKAQVRQTAEVRESNNKSTFVDNQNILDGAENIAYTEAKIAAIEKLNQGVSESEVLSAARNAAEAHFATIQKNLLKSWNESVREFRSYVSVIDSHADVGTDFVLPRWDNGTDTYSTNVFADTTEATLSDGSAFTVERVSIGPQDSQAKGWDPLGKYNDNSNTLTTPWKVAVDGGVTYLRFSDWNGLYTSIGDTLTNVENGLSTWVTSVYGDVQSGDLELSDLVTPRERAAMMADGEGTSQAIADLIALNVPVDLEREATITHGSTGAKLVGTFGLTDETDGPLVAGESYNVSNFAGDVYFTTDLSLMEGDWSEINTGVDGGTITLTAEPYEGTNIEVTTVAGETVSVPAADWTDNGDGTWSYDASDDLETTITDVESARFVSASTEVQYETLSLEGTFTVESLENAETGETVSETSFTSTEPQTDSNYITQKEWDDMVAKNEELIQKYEDSQNNGGGLDLSGLDMFGLPGEIVALAAAAVAFLFASK